jgi:BASS family bile acid:Na+ symporter
VLLVVVVTVIAPLYIGLLVVASIPVLIMEWPTIRSLLGDGTVVAAVLLSALGLLVGHLLGGPDPENRTVLALATVSRHPGVALVEGD